MNQTRNVFTLFFFFLSLNLIAQWRQLGSDIEGVISHQNAGVTDMTPDGSTIVIGSPGFSGAGTSVGNGQVKVYELIGGSWIQKGNDITDVTSSNSHLGSSVSISNNGNIVAVGIPGISRVIAFEWNGSNWIKKGANIQGQTYSDYFGNSISLSGDGNILVIGAPVNSNLGGLHAGHVRVYEWSNGWFKKGTDINGINASDRNGHSVDINDDGTFIVISAPEHAGNGQSTGLVRVFSWNGNNWVQKGQDLYGITNYKIGKNVQISDDGNVIASNSFWPFSPSQPIPSLIRAYEWNGTAWVQRGMNLGPARIGIEFGLSGDGLRIVNSDSRTAGLSVMLNDWNGSSWIQNGNYVYQTGTGLFFPSHFSLSYTGDTIVIGSNDSHITNGPVFLQHGGYAMAYTDSSPVGIDDLDNEKNGFIIYPNPTNGLLHIHFENASINSIEVLNQLGQRIDQLQTTGKTKVQFDIKGRKGIYFIRLIGEDGVEVQKVIKN